jgi:NADH:ubiquinone oxidoreductase subunit 4 (subunit M)
MLKPLNQIMLGHCLPGDRLILIPIVGVMLWIGVYSAPFLRRMDASIQLVQRRIERARVLQDGGYRVETLRIPSSHGEAK